jgi:glycosyltransferase involved in cell wall biosynthesis
LRIAQVAPLYESVPPKCYGGTERVASYLTEELVRLGHDVTLFASGDSVTAARLIAPCERSLRLDPNCVDQLAHHVTLVEQVFKNAANFDIIHFHIDYLHFPVSSRMGTPNVTTLHGRLDIPDLAGIYREFPQMRVVSISDSQRLPLPSLNWQGTVHHGLPPNLYHFHDQPGNYLAFLGRISPEKGVDKAIEIAKRVGMHLKIAAKVDSVDRAYFEDRIQPLLDGPLVEFIGEIDETEKEEFLGNAYALLFPIDWPEPFGLVMIEAMRCGTPIVAYRRGAVPEVIDEGVTGFICEDVDQAANAVQEVATLSRKRCGQVFEERFNVTRMAMDYVSIYKKIIACG